MLWLVKDPSKMQPDSVPKTILELSIALLDKQVIPTSVFLLIEIPDFCKYRGSTSIFRNGFKAFLPKSRFQSMRFPSNPVESIREVFMEYLESIWEAAIQRIDVILSLCPWIDPTP